MGDGADPEVFTAIANVHNLGGPEITKAALDVTAHDGNGWMDFVGNLKDGGEISLELNWDPGEATHDLATGLLGSLVNESQPTNWQVVWPDDASTTWDIAAIVTAFGPSAPVDEKLTASVTLKVSGQPTLV
jgi:predicted secreted protein